MSVQCNTYVMWGALLPYKEFRERYEELEPYMDSAFKAIHHHEGLCVLFDGMCGKYVAIGHVIAKSENGEGFPNPIKIDGVVQGDLPSRIATLARCEVECGYIVLSHYR